MAYQSKIWRRVVSRISFSEEVFQINFMSMFMILRDLLADVSQKFDDDMKTSIVFICSTC